MSVFISGANGYIAKHIIGDLLDQNYKVIGTVRSQTKLENLEKQFDNNPNLTLEIVEDICKPVAFDNAIKKHCEDIKYVLHNASPFFFDTTDYVTDLLNPALYGTRGILESIKKYGSTTVERVVITSSFATVFDYVKKDDDTCKINEESWNPDTWESCQTDNAPRAYCGSKKFAEQAAWEFLKANKDNVKFKLSTVNPDNVFGPQKFDADVSPKLNTSCELINQVIHTPADAQFDPTSGYGGFVDVRDVAKAHLLAFQNENTINQRLIMHNGKFCSQDIADVLNEDFSCLKGKIPVGKPHTGALYNSPRGVVVDNSKTKQILGFKFIDLTKSIYDTAAQILKTEGRL